MKVKGRRDSKDLLTWSIVKVPDIRVEEVALARRFTEVNGRLVSEGKDEHNSMTTALARRRNTHNFLPSLTGDGL